MAETQRRLHKAEVREWMRQMNAGKMRTVPLKEVIAERDGDVPG